MLAGAVAELDLSEVGAIVVVGNIAGYTCTMTTVVVLKNKPLAACRCALSPALTAIWGRPARALPPITA